ncbi:hypothetical protein ACXZ9C_11035 [Streptococcus agalactiae]
MVGGEAFGVASLVGVRRWSSRVAWLVESRRVVVVVGRALVAS